MAAFPSAPSNTDKSTDDACIVQVPGTGLLGSGHWVATAGVVFLADPSPDRRAKLIDALLERPEFVDYWAYKWSDVFLVSSRKLSQPAMRAFYQFVRESVADNKPWDQFARAIVTAQGSNLQNGPANYFILHKEEAIAGLLRRRGLRLPGFPSPEFAHDLYFVIGAAVTLVSVLKIVFAGQL